ncbi:MAG: DUF2203 domain-containing protein [Deltaproteobacteria bacterium]|nr:DUF2203 domain-containing protein [Deltaproteobacteria bacterium]
MKSRVFSFEEACTALDTVRGITHQANERMQDLRGQLEKAPPGSTMAHKLSEWINTVINQWNREISELGALPKGLWTVDFDSGRGFYYCWTLNEESLRFCHGYDEGFIGRRPLTDEQL